MHYELVKVLVKGDGYVLPRWMPTGIQTNKINEYFTTPLQTKWIGIENTPPPVNIPKMFPIYNKLQYPLEEIIVIR
jgi:hypothetical protein